jgi:hypothetical protein
MTATTTTNGEKAMLHYLSADEMYRCQMASRYGAQLHQHPVELSAVPSHGTLIIDYDHILFDSKAEAVAAAQRWLALGGVDGMHAYYPTTRCWASWPAIHVPFWPRHSNR